MTMWGVGFMRVIGLEVCGEVNEVKDTMADVNVNIHAEQAPAMAPPTHTDEQILPRIRWVPIGKSNCYLDAESSFGTLFAMTESPGATSVKLDEQWFDLTKDTLRDALRITPVNNNKAFSSPPTLDNLIQFVNDLGYLKEVHQADHLSPTMRKHNFHPRPESPLHLPTEEPALGYLKFSAKGTKREVFGMPIPNDLITDDIRGAQYYDAFLEKVVKHQRYLAGEEVSDPDSPAPKPAKPTKPKATKQAKPVAPKAATKKPKPAPAKPQDKKRKPVSQQLVDEGVPLTEPRFGDLEADTQRAIEESLKEAHGAHRGPLPPVVFRETDPGKLQPLPEVQGKGKEKVGEEQAAQVLHNLQTPKKKSSAEYDTELDEEVSPVVKSGAQDEGQAGPNPGKQDEGHARPNPGNDTMSQPQSTPIHAEPNLEHANVEATDASSQPQPEQIDEGFTATVYPNVQENLKLTADEPVIPEEPPAQQGIYLLYNT
ncbi:hypothetical protein Tco_0109181 [Tanacetum coccineum]